MSENKYGKRYDGKFKLKICKSIENGELTFSEAIRKYELNDSTLCSWLRLYRDGKEKELKEGRPKGKQKNKLYKPRGCEILESKKKLSQEEEIRLLKMKNTYYEKLIKYLMDDDIKKKL